MNLDPATLFVGASIGGGVGSLATLVIIALIVRYVFRTWQEFDALRTQSLVELRSQNDELRKRVTALEEQQGTVVRRGRSSSVGGRND